MYGFACVFLGEDIGPFWSAQNKRTSGNRVLSSAIQKEDTFVFFKFHPNLLEGTYCHKAYDRTSMGIKKSQNSLLYYKVYELC